MLEFKQTIDLPFKRLFEIEFEMSSAPRSPVRPDGQMAREKLVMAALRLFAEHGFSKTSIRDIAEAAQANVAAIAYYFGDKAGLYRAAFSEPMCDERPHQAQLHGEQAQPAAVLAAFFQQFLEPLKRSDTVKLCMRLHFREMVEPTGLWGEEIENAIKPQHMALVHWLTQYLGLPAEDDAVHQLAFAMVGMAIQPFIGRDIVEHIRPQLYATPEAIDRAASKMAYYAEAMLQAEKQQRQTAEPKF